GAVRRRSPHRRTYRSDAGGRRSHGDQDRGCRTALGTRRNGADAAVGRYAILSRMCAEVPVSCKATRRSGYALDGVNFFVAAMQASFGVFVTVYLVRSHWAAQDIGFALAISTVASLCSQIPAGALIDAIPDKRRPVRIGLLGIGAAGQSISSTLACWRSLAMR